MKKTLLTATLVATLAMTSLSANAFCWRNLNPANWGTCPKCEKTAQNCGCGCQKSKCNCAKKEKKACPVKDKCEQQTPKCNPCEQEPAPCNPCDKLQQETERK